MLQFMSKSLKRRLSYTRKWKAARRNLFVLPVQRDFPESNDNYDDDDDGVDDDANSVAQTDSPEYQTLNEENVFFLPTVIEASTTTGSSVATETDSDEDHWNTIDKYNQIAQYSSQESDDGSNGENDSTSLQYDLASWATVACRNSIAQNHIDHLLKILRKRHPELPATTRTLLKTQSSVVTGKIWHELYLFPHT